MTKFKGASLASSLCITALALGLAQTTASAEAWRFGIISDTQWVDNPDDGFSPNSIPAGIIRQIDQTFIKEGVKLVISVGDTVDKGSKTNIDTRALLAQELYNAGIGFYMVRGNHEDGWYGTNGSGPEIRRVFPQNINGLNGITPADCNLSLIPFLDEANLQLPDNAQVPFVVGYNFSSPTNIFNGVAKNGLTYSFDFANARFVMLDMFDDSSNNKTSVIPQQQPWIDAVLADPARPQHAFVFTHKNILGGQHKDNMFGSTINGNDAGDCAGVDYNTLSAANQTLFKFKQAGEAAFINSLASNNVHYMFGGHDHHHCESIVKSPLSDAKVHQVILASDSNKFYVPQLPVSPNEMPISQELNTVGCYICTVDGDNVTVDYYAVDISGLKSFKVSSPTENTITDTPALTGNWVKSGCFGYSLNGQEFIVPQGGSYAVVGDNTDKAVKSGAQGYLGTAAQILAGVNGSSAKTVPSNGSRPLVKAVNTGWAPAEAGLASDILNLWGMADLGTSGQTDGFVLAMTFDPQAPREHLGNGGFGLATRDSNGNWVNAVSMNFGGRITFVKGPWKSGYPVGTYGVDVSTKIAWAVVNHNGEFAVSTGIEPVPGHRK